MPKITRDSTIEQAAEATHIAVRTLRGYVKERGAPCERRRTPGNRLRIYFNPPELEAWMRSLSLGRLGAPTAGAAMRRRLAPPPAPEHRSATRSALDELRAAMAATLEPLANRLAVVALGAVLLAQDGQEIAAQRLLEILEREDVGEGEDEGDAGA